MTRAMLAPISLAISALVLSATPAVARDPDTSERQPDRPITNRDINAVDVATTPMTDLNIRKDEIPQLLIDAQASPYVTTGLKRCSQLAAAIGEFDAVLGDDIDLPQGAARRVSAGKVAQSVVGSFIPFRGIVRELSGANAQDRQVQAAIQAGLNRRAFLKGVGQERGCRYPARSATREIWDERAAAIKAAADADKQDDGKVADASRK